MAEQTSWKDRLSFLSPKCIKHTIGEGEMSQAINFYPVSVRVAFRLKSMAKPLAQAISALFTRNRDDCRQMSRKFKDPGGEEGEETTVEAIDLALARYRDERRDKAIEQMIEAFADPQNQMIVAELLMDSMRDICPRNPTAEDLQQFIASLTVDTLFGMLTGVAKANFGVLEGNVLKAAREKVGAAFGRDIEKTEGGSTSPTTSSSSSVKGSRRTG